MIDHMNRTMHKHIVTIEDPIEFLHRDRNSIINQREVGQDTASFKRALRRVLRQDPDVILVGEMRDEETVHTALSAAETGHLVLSTLHTVDAPETINRIIDFFPPHQQQQARAMIAGTLKGIISQRLVRTADGNGRVATLRDHGHDRPRARHDHRPEADRACCREVVAEGGYYGMQTFDQHLLEHLHAGRDHDGGRHARRHLAARLQADGRGAGADPPRSHPNKGEADRRRARGRRAVAPAPTDAPPAAPAPASRPPSRPRRLPRSRRRRLRRPRLRRPPPRRDAAAVPGRRRASGAAADAVGAAPGHPVLIA